MITDLARHVYKTLGHGYSEAVYHRALEVALRKKNIPYESERVVPITYEGHVVGNIRLDLVINNETIIELKTVTTLREKEVTQLKNYMNITGLNSGLLINFPITGGYVEVHTVS